MVSPLLPGEGVGGEVKKGMMPPDSANDARTEFDRAVQFLQAGELVAFPTDTVYGVGALAWNDAAVAKLYTAKLRPAEKAIPILLADPGDIALVAQALLPAALRVAKVFWPGPLTIVVRKSAHVSDEVTSGSPTVAVRVPDHPLARDLIRAAGAPLATTSANLSGQPSPVTAQEVAAQLHGRIAMILDGGACPGGVASTVVDLTSETPVILRPGPITLNEILAAL
jgi:L-threonylcarbamoyladenylate synthase